MHVLRSSSSISTANEHVFDVPPPPVVVGNEDHDVLEVGAGKIGVTSQRLRRCIVYISLFVFVYCLYTDVLMVSMDMFRVTGGGVAPSEVSGVRSKPAYNVVFAVGALPVAFALRKSGRRWYWSLALGILASLLVMIGTASYLQLLCAYSSRDMSQLCDLALDIQHEVDETFGTKKMWIINGNLLAVARNQSDINFLIANDHDFDLCATSDLFDNDKLAKHLAAKGMVFERIAVSEFGKRKVTVFPHNLPLYKYHSGPPMVDIDECDAPTELIEVTGCNKGMFFISNRWEEWLNIEYGASWRTPVNVNHKGLCTISSWW